MSIQNSPINNENCSMVVLSVSVIVMIVGWCDRLKGASVSYVQCISKTIGIIISYISFFLSIQRDVCALQPVTMNFILFISSHYFVFGQRNVFPMHIAHRHIDTSAHSREKERFNSVWLHQTVFINNYIYFTIS